MDDIDNRLIAALRHDARASLSALAGLVGVTRATVRSRLEKLEARGDILGYRVVTKGDIVARPVRALMMIFIEGRGAGRILARISGLPEVRAVHTTNGKWDMVVEIGVETLEELDGVLATIRRFDGVNSSETSILLASKKVL
ncbi:MAG: Lrp/AsnC family transcriptional regulator [Rhodobacteraceae bacterium]|nr:Lrp/AsnC family transcriptional regulator [Paracoccaceae bacterium]